MNTLTRTIVVFAVASLISAGSLPAQNTLDENSREALVVQREAQIAQKEAAQKQVQAAQQQVEAGRRRAEVERTRAEISALAAQPAVPAASTSSASAISVRGPWSSLRGGDGAVLVIPSAEIEAEDVAAITEDMNVMSRILEKNLEQARIATARGGFFALNRDPLVTLLGGAGTIEGMYLQGYGALFLMRMDFPLSAPPQVEEEKPAEKEAESDPVWAQMRREMYEPPEAARGSRKEPEQKYDAEKVENLKTTLIKALKHAANIRSLKSDESMILTVTGSGESAGAHVAASHSRAASHSSTNQVVVENKSGDGTATARVVSSSSSDQTTYFSPTALVIRAKKSDIDEFAKGTLDADQFRQRVQVLACPYLTEAAGHGDPFGMGAWRSVQYR
jgi:hypothetical protein